jgi:hypothetical protein
MISLSGCIAAEDSSDTLFNLIATGFSRAIRTHGRGCEAMLLTRSLASRTAGLELWNRTH